MSEQSVAEAYLSLLAARGVDYIFGNAGTDFPPIIEALARAKTSNAAYPIPVVVPHENVAVAMAHGYTMMTGRPQAVMVHVGLGTANALNGIYNAARLNMPMLLAAGRTPITEGGVFGARNNYINWAQEMFDQAGMVRELVKWEYELRHPAQLETVIDRALAISATAPQGPVYLTLPREVLAGPMNGYAINGARMTAAAAPRADEAALAELAGWLATAEAPLIVTANAGRDEAGWTALSGFATRHGVPVFHYRPRYMGLATDHPMHCGYDATAMLPHADLIIVAECDVPWMPDQARFKPGARVVHIGADPLFQRYPIRGFRADLAITADLGSAWDDLDRATERDEARIASRRSRVATWRAKHNVGQRGMKTPAATNARWVSACLEKVKDADTIVINEYPLALEEISVTKPMTYFSHSPAGGLGWSMGAALGAKLARPEATVVACVGDGTYMFGNPTPTHFVGRAMDLPVLTIVFNNARWAAVHRATLSMYPDGAAARDNAPPFSCLEPSPDFEKLVEASGGYGEKVSEPGEIEAALRRGLKVVREERRQAVINVICEPVYVRTS